jgi:hypothetical protein
VDCANLISDEWSSLVGFKVGAYIANGEAMGQPVQKKELDN